MDYQTHNVKFHFKTDSEVFTKSKIAAPPLAEARRNQNFVVRKFGKTVFTIFTSGHVNATGVKSFSEISAAVKLFSKQFGLSYDECSKSVIIDNSTSSAFVPLKNRLNLALLRNKLGNSSSLSLRPHFFPGAVIRRKEKCTIVIFTTGRFIIIGAKSPDEVREAFDTICAIIQDL